MSLPGHKLIIPQRTAPIKNFDPREASRRRPSPFNATLLFTTQSEHLSSEMQASNSIHASESTNNDGVSPRDTRPTRPRPVSRDSDVHEFASPVTSHRDGQEAGIQNASHDDDSEYEPLDRGLEADDVRPRAASTHPFGDELSHRTL